ncbi:MAG: hypothetical protein E7620_09440 [Ruminococcaceae bacterium]|nr:hypothetical protein [Oscillospiraceae bacterium]
MVKLLLKKSTTRSLTLSLLAVLLCVATLGGATYALFTYEEPAANVIVRSGEVDVDLLDENGVTLDNEPLQFRNVNGDPNILWEPGATFLSEPFYIKNIGDVTLNFRVLLIGAGMESSEFLDAFDPCIVDAEGNVVDLSRYQHELKAGESSGEFRVRMKMKESAGNKYGNRQFDGIAVSVYAIQGGVDPFTQQPLP